MWTPLIVTCVIAIISTVIGFGLYRFSVIAVEQKGVRLSGASVIAVAAYLGMSWFYMKISDRERANQSELQKSARDALHEYDDCKEQEWNKGFHCMEQADQLRKACAALLPD